MGVRPAVSQSAHLTSALRRRWSEGGCRERQRTRAELCCKGWLCVLWGWFPGCCVCVGAGGSRQMLQMKEVLLCVDVVGIWLVFRLFTITIWNIPFWVGFMSYYTLQALTAKWCFTSGRNASILWHCHNMFPAVPTAHAHKQTIIWQCKRINSASTNIGWPFTFQLPSAFTITHLQTQVNTQKLWEDTWPGEYVKCLIMGRWHTLL